MNETMALYKSSLSFRQEREKLLAGNIANADTPGYRRRDLRFEALLAKETATPARTHASHLPAPASASAAGPGGFQLELGPPGTRPDRNGVDLDTEVVEAHRNAGAFIQQSNMLSRLSTMLRTAMGSNG